MDDEEMQRIKLAQVGQSKVLCLVDQTSFASFGENGFDESDRSSQHSGQITYSKNLNYETSSASNAAMHPVPADVIACR